jgi:hypothetical protein
MLEQGELARVWALARRLRAESGSPYDFARRVEAHLANGYRYTETPVESARTLDGFLFDAREGYCQQFSGAMALLLRLGGVPARVASGFTSGTLDKDTREYVVRDLDAHSWVEAWFTGYGWVSFDPTPISAPPRAQSLEALLPTGAVGDVGDLGESDPLDPRTARTGDGGMSPVLVALLAAAAVAALAAAGAFVRRPPAGIAELERALRRSRLPVTPATTLQGLEERLAAHPIAAAYVRAVRRERYGGEAAARPTAAERRALRAALSAGGPIGRLRGWWAVPPRRN